MADNEYREQLSDAVQFYKNRGLTRREILPQDQLPGRGGRVCAHPGRVRLR